MFAYGIAASRLRFGLGVDAPLERLTAPSPLRPFAEYHAQVVTASPDPAFASSGGNRNRDQHWMTFGLRARVYRGLTLDAGVDVGLRSVGYEYGPPVPPYDVIFGAHYPFDVAAFSRPVVVTRTIEKAPRADDGDRRRDASRTRPTASRSPRRWCRSAGSRARGSRPIRTAASRASRCRRGPPKWRSPPPGSSPRRARRRWWRAPSATMEVALVAKIVERQRARQGRGSRRARGMAATLRFIGANHLRSARRRHAAHFRRRCRPAPTASSSKRPGSPARRSRSISPPDRTGSSRSRCGRPIRT